MSEVIRYEGERLHAGPRVFTVDGAGSRQFLEHRVHISGFGLRAWEWGFVGQRPAELAINLLVDALGDRATCSRCHGKGEYRAGRCGECGGHGVDPVVFGARFAMTWIYIAGLPETRWVLERPDIVAWFERFAAGLYIEAAC